MSSPIVETEDAIPRGSTTAKTGCFADVAASDAAAFVWNTLGDVALKPR